MRLEVRGMATANQTFVQLWGMYVRTFDPTKHCIYCLKGRKEAAVHRRMIDGDYELATDFPYFYLFAMGRGARSISNVHLPVRPHPGAVASIGSVYGVTFTICDAYALRVDRLPDGWEGLGKDYTSCRNFQFGVQEFGYRPPVDSVHSGDATAPPGQVS
jgi:hypothetical protein